MLSVKIQDEVKTFFHFLTSNFRYTSQKPNGVTLSSLDKFRKINTIEGYSFIILVFIAMPLKYYFGFPIATKIVGIIHAILFVWFIYQLLLSQQEVPFNTKETLLFFILSLIPLGSFYTEKLCSKKIKLLQ